MSVTDCTRCPWRCSRSDFLAQTSYSGECDDGLDAEVLQRGNVGSRGHVGRSNVVTDTVTSDEGELDGSVGRVESGNRDRRRGFAPGLPVASK